MTYVAQSTLAADTTFIARVTQAAITGAKDVMAEAASTNGHAKRTEFAVQVLRSAQVYGPLMAQGVASNVAISAASTDSDIQFTVNSLWDAYSGVTL